MSIFDIILDNGTPAVEYFQNIPEQDWPVVEKAILECARCRLPLNSVEIEAMVNELNRTRKEREEKEREKYERFVKEHHIEMTPAEIEEYLTIRRQTYDTMNSWNIKQHLILSKQPPLTEEELTKQLTERYGPPIKIYPLEKPSHHG